MTRSAFSLPSSRLVRIFTLLLFLGVTAARAQRAAVPDYELPPVNYSKATSENSVTRLQRRLETGELSFKENGKELLLAVLRALRVPVETQTLVFTKTSLQKALITPATPRALYFSESVYVGWVPGGDIEVAVIDPQLGPVFYRFNANTSATEPRGFVRDASCMLCHGYFFVRDVPVLLALTGIPGADGELLPRTDFDLVDDAIRFEKRWGGWYVSGYTGQPNHRGNAVGSGEGKAAVLPASEKRPAELSEFFDTSRYPAGTSDMAGLLILEHQMAMYNSITRVGQNVRLGKYASESDVVDHLLFRRGAVLPEGVVKNEAFLKVFLADAKRDRAGDSLKDLRLDGRIFKNRCSYLIYSEAFAALPEPMKDQIYEVLYVALRDTDSAGRYAYLESDEKQRIYDILMETHPEARRHFEQTAARRRL